MGGGVDKKLKEKNNKRGAAYFIKSKEDIGLSIVKIWGEW